MAKALTVKQPWASLIAHGFKKYEFRSWNTNYRGTVYLHVSSNNDYKYIKKFENLGIDFPKSKIIAMFDIVDCIKIDDAFNEMLLKENNIVYGTKKREGYAWVIDNVKLVNNDSIIKGRLGLWNIDL